MSKLASRMKQLCSDRSGLAGIEFALASTALTVGLLNGLEVARWSFQRMEVANAVHSATLAAWNACDTKHLPATTKCTDSTTGLTAAINAGLTTTSLGNSVTLASGFPTEAYYCVNSSGVLTQVATVAAGKPANCTAVGDTAHTPGDYVVIKGNYTYSPLFGQSLTVGSLMATDLSSTGYIRLQ
jgi:Flp pilus assembly protein TadG